MSAAFIQVAPDDASGKKVQTFENSIGGNTVEAQAVVLVDSSGVAYLPVTANSPISPATKTKITYDAKGLVTSGADATTADIPDSTDRRYITDSLDSAFTNAGESTLIGRGEGSGDGEVEQIDFDSSIVMSGSTLSVNPSAFVGGLDGQVQYNYGGVFDGIVTTFTDGANLFLDGPIISDDFTNGVSIEHHEASPGYASIEFQANANKSLTLRIMPTGTVAVLPTFFQLLGTDYSADSTNWESLNFISRGSSFPAYHVIESNKGGTGTVRPINIAALGDYGATVQLVIGTDGGVSIGTGTAAGDNNLLVAGTITGSNLSGTHSGTSSGTNTGDQTLAGLGGTQAAIVPNTVPSAGQILAGNAGATAYAPVTLSGSGVTATLSALGVLTLSAIANASLANSSMTLGGTSTALGGTQEILATTTRPTISATIPANYSAVVGGDSFTLDSGITLTIASGANLTLL